MDNKIQSNQRVAGDISSISDNGVGLEAVGLETPREALLESMSAMMDDEAESLEFRRVIKSAEQAPQLLSHWRRYHAVRASLHHEIHTTPSVDLLAGINARLASEGIGSQKIRKPLWSGRMVRIAGQGVIAATVAAAILVGYPILNGSREGAATGSAAPALVANHDGLPQMNGDYTASALTRTVSLDDAARHRLETAVRNFSGTTAVLNNSNSRMLVNQLEPFAPNAPVNVSVKASAIEEPAQHR